MRLLRDRTWLAGWAASGLLVAHVAFAAGPLGIMMPGAAAAQEAAAPADGAAPAPATAPPGEVPKPAIEPAVAIPEISSRADDLANRIRVLQGEAGDDSKLVEMTAQLKESRLLLDASAEETAGFLSQGPRLTLLDDMEVGWKEGLSLLTKQREALTKRVRAAQDDLEALRIERDLWERTLTAARSQDAPASVLERVTGTLTAIEVATQQVTELRARVLTLQEQAAAQITQAEETLELVAQHRQKVVDEIWVADAPPLWAFAVRAEAWDDAEARIDKDFRDRLERAWAFLELRGPVVLGQILAAILLAMFFVQARRRTARWKEVDPGAADALRVLELPYSSAAVLALISTLVVHPGVPRILIQLVSVLALLPVVRILRPLVPPSLRWELYALTAFFLLDRIRDLAASAPIVDQSLLALEMVLGIALLGLILRQSGGPMGLAGPENSGLPRVRLLERLLFVGFLVALVACTVGYMQLARLVASAGLAALYVGMALYAGARALRGLLAVALRIRPFVHLNLVRNQRALIEERVGRWIGWSAVGLWFYVTLSNLSLLDSAGVGLNKTLDASVSFGTVTFTLGDVVAMALTLWVSILVSRFVRFVLQEDVFPRVALARGVPYALSNLVGYVIVLVGFLLALTTIGLDASRFTILAGAFGVGIGFGMQNIVNNFVSGLILLFERPIQVGDVVQIGEVMGEVRRIGIRSSTVRTFTGAEVIVPNADLIAERVTNWTLSDSTRRVEIPVGVAYGTDPKRVLEVLTEVAQKHEDVLTFPAPMAIFVQFGDSAIDFELRAWVANGTRWSQTRTEIAVSIWEALREAGISIPFPQREVRVLSD